MFQDYPDYYEVIKKPIDMSSISQKMLLKRYESLEDMVADFVQMFDNACKYNEPDSLIYKVTLQLLPLICSACLQKYHFTLIIKVLRGTHQFETEPFLQGNPCFVYYS